MNLATHVTEMEQHLRKLAGIPGWQPYAVKKAAGMAKEVPSMYGHLPKVVADTIQEKKQ